MEILTIHNYLIVKVVPNRLWPRQPKDFASNKWIQFKQNNELNYKVVKYEHGDDWTIKRKNHCCWKNCKWHINTYWGHYRWLAWLDREWNNDDCLDLDCLEEMLLKYFESYWNLMFLAILYPYHHVKSWVKLVLF